MTDDPRVEAAFDAYLGEIMKHSNERKAMRAALTAADRVALERAPELANWLYKEAADWRTQEKNYRDHGESKHAGMCADQAVPFEQAAATLTAQAARIAELERALGTIVKRCPFTPTSTGILADISFEQIKMARAALAQEKPVRPTGAAPIDKLDDYERRQDARRVQEKPE